MDSNFQRTAADIIRQLSANRAVFKALLTDVPGNAHRWRSAPDKWSLLEIICHLYDEEREDFRARVRHVLEHPDQPMPPIDPVGWVNARSYADQDFTQQLQLLLAERGQSVRWLESLVDPPWENTYEHPTLGPLSARQLLASWLAHDYLHLRQITRLKYQYLQLHSAQDLSYAGTW